MIVSAHLPCVGAQFDACATTTVEEISAVVHSWKTRSENAALHIVLGGDLNITLPANRSPFTGTRILERQHRTGIQRREEVMEWMVSLELRAVSIFPAEIGDGQELWTWGNSNGVRTQIDYICCSEGLLGVASVPTEWKTKSDHRPVVGKFHAKDPLAAVWKKLSPLTRWIPDTDTTWSTSRSAI